jgi:hypothetical protein
MKEEKMRTRIILIMLCIMFLGCIWIADSFAEPPPSYQMVCKGGGNMSGSFVTYDTKKIVINFAKSPQAGSRQEPAPGTCAWVDRPLNPQEPSTLVFVYEKTAMMVDFRYQNMTLRLDPAFTPDGNLRYLWDAVYNGKIFYFRCYNDARGGLIITHVGP